MQVHRGALLPRGGQLVDGGRAAGILRGARIRGAPFCDGFRIRAARSADRNPPGPHCGQCRARPRIASAALCLRGSDHLHRNAPLWGVKAAPVTTLRLLDIAGRNGISFRAQRPPERLRCSPPMQCRTGPQPAVCARPRDGGAAQVPPRAARSSVRHGRRGAFPSSRPRACRCWF